MFTLLFAFLLYFLPSILAAHRDHPSRIAILFVNLFFGWTIIGWAVTLLWALTGPAHRVIYVPYQQLPRR